MKDRRTLHLNLLRANERVSPSPVRVRIIVPFLAVVALLAVLGWWGFLRLQISDLSVGLRQVDRDIAARDGAYRKVVALQKEEAALSAECGQLSGFRRGRFAWAEALAAVAALVPEGMQLTSLEIPPPPPQQLKPPPGVRRKPLLGPTNAVESVTLRLAGRVTDEPTLFRFLAAVRSEPALTNVLVFADAAAGKAASPRIRSFRQEASADADGARAIVFDLEYRTKGRDFAP